MGVPLLGIPRISLDCLTTKNLGLFATQKPKVFHSEFSLALQKWNGLENDCFPIGGTVTFQGRTVKNLGKLPHFGGCPPLPRMQRHKRGFRLGFPNLKME